MHSVQMFKISVSFSFLSTFLFLFLVCLSSFASSFAKLSFRESLLVSDINRSAPLLGFLPCFISGTGDIWLRYFVGVSGSFGVQVDVSSLVEGCGLDGRG